MMTLVCVISLIKIQAQTHAEQNLQKYWVYRERFKNFCVVRSFDLTRNWNLILSGGKT